MPSISRSERYRRIVSVLVDEGFATFFDQLGMRASWIAALRGRHPHGPDASLSPEQRLRRTMERLGPTFAKIGQMLSVRPDLIPAVVRRRARQAAGRDGAVPVRAGQGRDRVGLRRAAGVAVPRVRRGAVRRGEHRPGAPGRAPGRHARGGQDPATRNPRGHRGRPRHPAHPGAAGPGSNRPGQTLRPRRPGRRVRAGHPRGVRLRARGRERRTPRQRLRRRRDRPLPRRSTGIAPLARC